MPANFFEKAKNLPANLKQVVFSDGPRLAVEEACLLYGVPSDEMGTATLPLGEIFLGELALSQYPSRIMQDMGIDEAKAFGIAFEVNKRIFLNFPNYFKDAASLQASWQAKKSNPILSSEAAQKKLFEEVEPGLFENQEEDIKENTLPVRNISNAKKLPLLKAITQYENLGQQLVTNEKIKVKNQPEPVRPSLANWIHYYRDELGIGFHDQVVRGRFLFQSENGKRLNNEERERVNLIMKSLEEDYPVDIDTERSVIVFPPVTRGGGESRSRQTFSTFNQGVPSREVKTFQPITPSVPTPPVQAAPVPSVTPAKPSFFASKFSPAKNVADETLHFSTGHVLPGEKNTAAPTPVSAAELTPAPSSATPQRTNFQPSGINRTMTHTLPRSPYSIRPLRLRNDTHEEENA